MKNCKALPGVDMNADLLVTTLNLSSKKCNRKAKPKELALVRVHGYDKQYLNKVINKIVKFKKCNKLVIIDVEDR